MHEYPIELNDLDLNSKSSQNAMSTPQPYFCMESIYFNVKTTVESFIISLSQLTARHRPFYLPPLGSILSPKKSANNLSTELHLALEIFM